MDDDQPVYEAPPVEPPPNTDAQIQRPAPGGDGG